MQEGETIERREIGKHAQTVAKILQEKTNQGDNVPLSTLVKEWRTKPANALSCVKQNPPGNELNAEECERTIVELVLHKIFRTYVVWTAYDSNIYLQLTERGRKFLQSSEPKVSMTFPKHEKRARKNATLENDDDSTAVKPAAKKRAKRSSSAASKTKVTAKSKKKKKGNAKARDTQQSPAPTEVIELCDSSDDEVVVEEMETTRSKRPVRAARSRAQVAVQNTLLAEDDFYDSHCSDEENEFAG